MTHSGSARTPIIISILFVLGLFFGLPLMWIMGANARVQQAEKEVVKERQAARAARLPLSGEDMKRNPPVPDADNAAPIYLQISAGLKAKAAQYSQLEKSALEIGTPKASATAAADARQLIALAQPELALMEPAAQKPDCDFKRNWDLGADLLLPEYADMRKMVRLLMIRAELLDRDGKPMEALKQIELSSATVRHLQQEPLLIGMLVQIALEAIADKKWHELVNRHSRDATFLARAEQVSKGFGGLPDLRNALRGEVLLGVTSVKKIREGTFNTQSFGGGEDDQPKMEFSSKLAPVYEKNLLIYWRKMFAAMDEAQGNTLQMIRAMERVTTEEEVAAKKDPAGYALNALLVPVFSQSGKRVVHVDVLRKLRQLKIELLKYRLANGSFPKDLSGFDAKLTADPFASGQTLEYIRENSGFRLWSVGENGVDDGGQKKIGNSSMADIVTSFPQMNDEPVRTPVKARDVD